MSDAQTAGPSPLASGAGRCDPELARALLRERFGPLDRAFITEPRRPEPRVVQRVPKPDLVTMFWRQMTLTGEDVQWENNQVSTGSGDQRTTASGDASSKSTATTSRKVYG
jgi:hypothetical protein